MTEREFWTELHAVLPGARVVKYADVWTLHARDGRPLAKVSIEDVLAGALAAVPHITVNQAALDAIFGRFLEAAYREAGLIEPAPQTWWQKVKTWLKGGRP